MDEQTQKELDEWARLIGAKIDNLQKLMDHRFEGMKRVIADYLELQSNMAMATIRANLKNV